MSITNYQISGMACGGCVNRVKATLADYAESVEVSLSPPQATLVNPKADIDTLNRALAKLGEYQLKEI